MLYGFCVIGLTKTLNECIITLQSKKRREQDHGTFEMGHSRKRRRLSLLLKSERS